MADNNFSSNKKVTFVSRRKPIKHKPIDKPNRPLSAYHYFFKNERIKIVAVVLHEKRNDANDLIPNLSTDQISKLKKDDGKISFEEIGKVIGRRWKDISPERLAYYKFQSKGDAERYKKEMMFHNEKKEEMRKTANMLTAELQNSLYSQNRQMPFPMQHYTVMPTVTSGIYGNHEGYMLPTYMEPTTDYRQMPMMHDYNSNNASYPPPTTEGRLRNEPHLLHPDNDNGYYTYGAPNYHPHQPIQSLSSTPQCNYSYLSKTRDSTQYPSCTQRNYSQHLDTRLYHASYPRWSNNIVMQNKG